jgi:nucleoside-diphosphate-sugar epimerase
MLAQRSALVTGATGFIGAHLANRLLAEGWTVRVLVRDAARVPESLRQRCEIVVADLGATAGLGAAVRGVEVIFHCAANVRTWDSLESYRRANVTGVANLLDAISKENTKLARLVHFSTMDVYGFPSTPRSEEDSPAECPFGYPRSKLEGERLAAERCVRASIPFTILRLGNVFGPGGQFVERISAALTSGVMLTVDGGRANAGLVYIDNLLDYVLWAAGAPQAAGRCYNVRDHYDVTWAEFIARLRSGLGAHRPVINLPSALADGLAVLSEGSYRAFLPGREPLLHRLLVRIFGRTCGHSVARIRAESGLVGRVGFEEGIERSIRSFLAARATKSA